MDRIIIIALITLIGGCASIHQEPRWSSSNDSVTELIVFRDAGGVNRGMAAYFGSEDNYVLAVKTKEYSKLEIPSGKHTFKIMGNGATSSKFELTLEENEVHCIRISGNPGQFVAVVVPTLLAVIPSFTATEVGCPSNDYFDKYSQITAKL